LGIRVGGWGVGERARGEGAKGRRGEGARERGSEGRRRVGDGGME